MPRSSVIPGLARLIVAAVIAALVIAPGSASARTDPLTIAQAHAELTESDVRYFVRRLELNADQADAAMDLYRGYAAACRDANRRLRDFQRRFFETHGRSLSDKDPEWKRATKVWEDYAGFMKRSRECLLDDLRTVLREDQAGRWNLFERHMRRRTVLGMSMSSIGRMDLIEITTSSLDEREMPPELAAVLESYESELDRALIGLEQALRQVTPADSALVDWESMSEDEVTALHSAMMKPVFEASKAVRDVNLRFRPRLEALLPEPARPGFAERFYSDTSITMTEQDRRATSAIDAARTAAGLTPAQSDQIDTIVRGFTRDAAALSDEVIKFTVAAEDAGVSVWDIYGHAESMEQLDQFSERRTELVRSVISRLRGVLTPEQLAEMPPPLRATPIEFPTFDD